MESCRVTRHYVHKKGAHRWDPDSVWCVEHDMLASHTMKDDGSYVCEEYAKEHGCGCHLRGLYAEKTESTSEILSAISEMFSELSDAFQKLSERFEK